MSEFSGKYRGRVLDNRDPLRLGRLSVKVPDVLGEESLGWALPCLPYAGPDVGFFVLPPVGASVWVEFENGDPDYPLWCGCFWEEGQLPESAGQPQIKLLKTPTTAIMIDDSSSKGSMRIETAGGMEITLNGSEIVISNGRASIRLAGNTVSINGNALEVT